LSREGGPFLPTEEPFMSEEEKKEGVRLSCRVKIKKNIRIIIPEALFKAREYNAKVARITDRTHDIKEIRLEVDEEVNFKAGQFMQLESKPYDKVRERAIRAYSISSVPPDRKGLEFIIRKVPGGICITYVFNHLKVGDMVRITGPYGNSTGGMIMTNTYSWPVSRGSSR
jgi:Na+-transporting NADH:ubiquinone oxidoreductase subunit F